MSGLARRLLDLFEGPGGLEHWAPPEMPAALADLLPWRAFDERSELYVNAGSVGFAIEIPPFAGIDEETFPPRPRARPTARRPRPGCRSIRSSGARAARAGCIR